MARLLSSSHMISFLYNALVKLLLTYVCEKRYINKFYLLTDFTLLTFSH